MSVVGNQPVLRVGFLPKVSEGLPLERLEPVVARRQGGMPGSDLLRAHAGASSKVRAATIPEAS